VVERNFSHRDELCETAMAVIEAGWGTTDDVRRASAWRMSHRPQLGKLALMSGNLKVQQVFEVLRRQAIVGGLFGEIAVELGFLERGTLYELLEQQARLTPTLSDALLNLAIITPEQALALAVTPQPAG
jgi:hypothetical protein